MLGRANNDSDKRLNQSIQDGIALLTMYCGPFDIESNKIARALVKHYVRFDFNGMAEQFYPHYKADIINLGFSLMGGDVDETV